jgi:hypothetical protein
MANEERNTKIKEMWALGHTAAEISAVIGISRSAVLSVVARLQKSGAKIDHRTAKRVPKINLPRATCVVMEHPLMDVPFNGCTFPSGDPKKGTLSYCGAFRTRGSYCTHHHNIAYYAPMPTRLRKCTR